MADTRCAGRGSSCTVATRISPERRWLTSLLLALFALAAAFVVMGSAATAQPVAKPPLPPLTRGDLEPWLDGFMDGQLRQGDLPGAVVVVVKDGQILLAKGYGYADVAARRRVDPEKTLFRVGSVTKLFTWTAVMQLVEAGKIDLDRDVNAYLDFRIPDNGLGPITMRNLMTHRGGFEEVGKTLITSDPRQAQTTSGWVHTRLPPRIFAPGTTPAYSNYGATLAGYIVERVSGERFEHYVAQHIFAPLGMTRASFAQPLAKPLAADLALGYAAASQPAKPFEYVNGVPAGALAVTGTDIARFMIAHLQNGQYGANHILQPATITLMRTPIAGIGPLHRSLLGFYETSLPGHRAIAHGGDLKWVHSDLQLFVDDGIGVFVSINGVGKDSAAAKLRAQLIGRFANRYLQMPPPAKCIDGGDARREAAAMAGSYLSSRRPETSFASLGNLFGAVKVAAMPGGRLRIDAFKDVNGNPKTFCRIAPFVWRNVADLDRIAAQVENGRVTRFGIDWPSVAFEPFPAAKSPDWIVPALGLACLAFLLTALAWPVRALVRWRHGVVRSEAPALARSRRWSRIGAVVMGVWALTSVAVFQALDSNPDLLDARLDRWLLALQAFTLVAVAAGSLIAAWRVIALWRQKAGWFDRAWSLALLAASVVFAWVVIAFHLASMKVAY